MARRPARSPATTILSRLEELAAFTSSPSGVTRLYLSREHKLAAERVMAWMADAGLTPRIDAAGTVVARIEGIKADAKTLLVGSHIDSVRNAGRFDGCLGVLVAIEAMAHLRKNGHQLPFAVEVLAFGDVEGLRFPSALTGSRVLAGQLDAAHLESTDGTGITLRRALVAFGCDPARVPSEARAASKIMGFVEVHIEQGTVLENEGLAVGVVTAISGASRFRIRLDGRSGHAGTLPMHMRRDALAAAAEMISAVERIGSVTPTLVATVGEMTIEPNAVNVVPGRVELTLDVRSPTDRNRRNGVRMIERELRAIAKRRGVALDMTESYVQKGAACDHRLIRHLTAAAERVAGETMGLPSGAGHDGQALADLCPVGMLFVRCKDGVSHHPDEFVRPEDIDTATRVLIDFLTSLSANGRTIE